MYRPDDIYNALSLLRDIECFSSAINEARWREGRYFSPAEIRLLVEKNLTFIENYTRFLQQICEIAKATGVTVPLSFLPFLEEQRQCVG